MIKKAALADQEVVTELALLLWPDNKRECLNKEIGRLISSANSAFFVAYDGLESIAFAFSQIRHDYVEGTDSSPVGYLEGIFVREKYRKRGIARRLLGHCEDWAKTRNCEEFASDCELPNVDSYHFHLRMGFEEVNRLICFKKKIRGTDPETILTNDSVIIRAAGTADREGLSGLIAKFRVELQGLKAGETAPDLEQAREELAEYIKEGFPVFVAENHARELIGYLVCRIRDGVVWAESLFVDGSWRRRGIGSKLYERAEELAAEFGEDSVYNWIHPDNDGIIDFLGKRGYTVLNLIEVRKTRKDEVLGKKINVGDHQYDYFVIRKA